MKSKGYHYEWAAYTDNLNWGCILIARSRSKAVVEAAAFESDKGCYRIVRERIYDN